jgi:hypothetical protein
VVALASMYIRRMLLFYSVGKKNRRGIEAPLLF